MALTSSIVLPFQPTFDNFVSYIEDPNVGYDHDTILTSEGIKDFLQDCLISHYTPFPELTDADDKEWDTINGYIVNLSDDEIQDCRELFSEWQ